MYFLLGGLALIQLKDLETMRTFCSAGAHWSQAMKLERLGTSLGAEEGSREALVLAEAREDITPPIIAMPIVPGVVLVGVRAPLQTR